MTDGGGTEPVCTVVWCQYNADYIVLEFILGSPYFRQLPHKDCPVYGLVELAALKAAPDGSTRRPSQIAQTQTLETLEKGILKRDQNGKYYYSILGKRKWKLLQLLHIPPARLRSSSRSVWGSAACARFGDRLLVLRDSFSVPGLHDLRL